MWSWRGLLWPDKRPAGVPDERWVLVGGIGSVILPADIGRVSSDWDLTASWMPTREPVLAAEDRVAGFLAGYPPHAPGDMRPGWHERLAAPLILAKLGNYRRQYAGILFEGRPALYMNFFPRHFEKRWATEPVEVCDGWVSYFQLIYRPIESDFPWFRVNGDA